METKTLLIAICNSCNNNDNNDIKKEMSFVCLKFFYMPEGHLI